MRRPRSSPNTTRLSDITSTSSPGKGMGRGRLRREVWQTCCSETAMSTTSDQGMTSRTCGDALCCPLLDFCASHSRPCTLPLSSHRSSPSTFLSFSSNCT
ncbi:hypothetical protein PHYPO_G00040730 [Pangasianodon hypophthalmus]|uniref:Uncharacterized protein n=1 Tax=Pangasianodon hypophthalmus TaxID=310915 RepID=A0A5N5MEQ0_PANHP|nr:hypothetical protein PHYPO_G00040730 [Pangasianodon hypophthalmus]